jgi:hypothetical protein
MSEDYQKVTYVAMVEEETRPLTWAEWFFGRTEEEEVPADAQSKRQKYLVTEQIKQSNRTHKLVQKDIPFPHTQSIVNTTPKMEDTCNALPSPYKPPQPLIPPKSILKNRPLLPQTPKAPKRVLHPSIAQQRKNLIKDDITI